MTEEQSNQIKDILESIRDQIIRWIDFFHKPFEKVIPKETFRYAATGGANTILDIFLYFVCYNFVLDKQIVHLGIVSVSPHIAAFMFVFPITFLTGFLLAKYITFTTSLLRGRIQLTRYAITVSGSILLNYVLLKFFVEVTGLWATFSKILTTIIVILYSYLVQRFYTFKTAGKAIPVE